MKSVITVLVFFVSVSISFAQPHVEQGGTNSPSPQTQTGWLRQHVDTKESVRVISMYNRDIGWIGTNGSITYKTINGGNNWNSTPIPQPKTTCGMRIYDDSNMYGLPLVGNSKVYKTSNGGATWEEQEINMQSTARDLIKLNQDTFIAHNGMNFTRTINGGKTWGLNGALILFNDMHFSDSHNGCVVGQSKPWSPNPNLPAAAGFMRTTNTGDSWEEFYTGIECEFRCVWMIDSNNIVAGGNLQTLAKSVDAGSTWKKNAVPFTEGTFHDIHFPSKTTGYAVSSGGHIMKTTNAGDSWIELNSTVRYQIDTVDPIYLRSVHFVDTLTGWVCGEDGIILHTTDGGKLWVSNPPPNNINITTFPEPASQLVTLHYQLPNVQHVSISLYMLSGTKVLDVLINVIQHQGTYNIPINTSLMPSGIYHYRFDSEQYHATGNFTIIR